MRRDGAGTKTRPETTVNATTDRSTVARTTRLPASLWPAHTSPGSLLNDTANSTVTARFYRSYNPSVGINTAVVLGGILSVLVLYVIYRTKCRKRLVQAFESCTMRYLHEEYKIPPEQNTTCDNTNANGGTDWISEKAKMIWQERAQFSENELKRKYSGNVSTLCSAEKRSNSQLLCNGGEVLECDTSEDVTVGLPATEENVAFATAHWVQHMPELDSRDKQLTGIILKIPQDLLSNASRKRCNFLSVTDYGTSENLSNICRNKSLPLLLDRPTALARATLATYANITTRGNVARTDCEPGMSRDDGSPSPGAQQLHVQHQSGARIPLDICPIIKIQHFHSRSKRRLTSLRRVGSDDSMTSESSEEPMLMDTTETKSDAATSQKSLFPKENCDHQPFHPIPQPLTCETISQPLACQSMLQPHGYQHVQPPTFHPVSLSTHDKLQNSVKGNLETSL